MAKTEIVYRDSEGELVNKVFDSFNEAYPLIEKLDRRNVYYDWYEMVNGEWVEASEVEVLA